LPCSPLRPNPQNLVIFTYVLKHFPNYFTDLEVVGLALNGSSEKTRCGLYLYIGDNLEAHSIGGFSLSFSHGNVCRYCNFQHKDIAKGRLHDFSKPAEFPPFTAMSKEEYESEERTDLKGCVFNELEAFHSAEQMPPCLGHDVFEGAVSYDLFSLLKMMVQKHKWFSLDALNQQIRSFPFDSKDRPYPIVFQNKEKLVGAAVQMWVLLRHILLILSPLGVDKCHLTYKLVERLVEITAMVTAPGLNLEELNFMECMIQGL
jgi:hypothetical protein